MQDIADDVGVSQSTVSLAFRNHPRIPERTRQRIRESAQRLGYEANAPISALMARIRANRPVEQHATIAAITSHGTRKRIRYKPVFRANWKGANERARKLGYQLQEFALDAPGMTTQRMTQILKSRRIEGIIVFPFLPPTSCELDWEHFSSICIGYNLTSPRLNRVSTDQYGSMKLGIEELAERGYRRPGMVIDASMNDRVERRWMSAFSSFSKKHGIYNDGSILLLTEEFYANQFRDWVIRFQPDVILGCGLLPVEEWLGSMEAGLDRQVDILGVSDAFYFQQDCSYINENQELVGSVAVDLLVGAMHRNDRGIPEHPTDTFIPGKWVEGDTIRIRTLSQ